MNFLELLSEHWNLISILVTVFTGFVLWHMSQRFVSRRDFEETLADLNRLREKHDETIHNMSISIIDLSASIKNIPRADALHRLELGLEEVRGLQRETAAQLKGQRAAMERMNNAVDRLVMGRRGADVAQ